MDRCALFVDAGYALADGAMAVHGTRRRDSVSWDHAGLLKLLAGLARDRTGLPVLRCYWYETAAEGRRTAEHDALAEMPGLKLRLVNALPGRREGIESQLRRDLVTLAKSGAICDAFVASANEHIAEIVAEVQDLGLRVVILHIASDGGWTVPLSLRQECDDIVEISGVHLRSYVDLIKGLESVSSDQQYRSAAVGALPAPGAIYQVHDASDYRPDYLSSPSHVSPSHASAVDIGQSAGSSPSSSAAPAAKETSQTGHSAPAGSTASPQPSASSATSGTQPYSAAGLQSGVYSIADQQHFGQARSPADYQGSAASYQNGSAGNYQNAAMQNGTGQPGTTHNAASQAPPGSVGGQNGTTPNFDGQNGVSQNGGPQALGGIAGNGGGGPNSAAPNGPGQDAIGQDGVGRPVGAQNGYSADTGLHSLADMGYQQQGAYQRGPGQSGPGQSGPDQNGTGSQNGGGYQVSSQNGAAQFGYTPGQHGQGTNSIGQGGQVNAGSADQAPGRNSGPVGYSGGQQGATQGGALPGYQQSTVGPNGAGQPAQAQASQQSQVPNGTAQGGYQAPPNSAGRSAAGQGSYQPAAAGPLPDPRQGDPRLADPRQGDPRQPDPRQGDPRLADPRQPDPRQGDPRQGDPRLADPRQGDPRLADPRQTDPRQGDPRQGDPRLADPRLADPRQPDPRQADPRQGDPRLADPRQTDPRQGDPRQGDPRQADPRQGDPRQRDPYGPALPPQMPTGLDAMPMSAQPQYAFGAPDASFVHGQPGAGPEQSGRAGFGPNPGGPNLAGQNPGQVGPVLQPQYQQQSPLLPAVRVQQPVAMALPDAVKAAHQEGFTFGESVGRDAPGLWLEAVLARKPRMPSDLEARLLQGSVLPIDSLLHDEVRHSLRRGFWDALESARR